MCAGVWPEESRVGVGRLRRPPSVAEGEAHPWTAQRVVEQARFAGARLIGHERVEVELQAVLDVPSVTALVDLVLAAAV
jgi:hypothetical protein